MPKSGRHRVHPIFPISRHRPIGIIIHPRIGRIHARHGYFKVFCAGAGEQIIGIARHRSRRSRVGSRLNLTRVAHAQAVRPGLHGKGVGVHDLGVGFTGRGRGRALVPIPDERTPPIVGLQGATVVVGDFGGGGAITGVVHGRPKRHRFFASGQDGGVTAHAGKGNGRVRHIQTAHRGRGGNQRRQRRGRWQGRGRGGLENRRRGCWAGRGRVFGRSRGTVARHQIAKRHVQPRLLPLATRCRGTHQTRPTTDGVPQANFNRAIR